MSFGDDTLNSAFLLNIVKEYRNFIGGNKNSILSFFDKDDKKEFVNIAKELEQAKVLGDDTSKIKLKLKNY